MDFKDCRSMKVVLVSHCHLNQNSRLWKCAECPASCRKLAAGLLEREVGIIQMPCPELMVLGLDRGHIAIRSGLESIPARRALRKLGKALAFQIGQYRDCGLRVLGVLGKNGSPACGVEQTSRSDGKGPIDGEGVFIQEFKAELRRSGCEVPVVGTMDDAQEAALAVVDGWLGAKS
jgi:predicted secreted protein